MIFTCAFLIHIAPGKDKELIIDKMREHAKKAIVLYESHTYGEPVLDVRKHDSHSPYCIDNYLNYGKFQVIEVENMIDYPENFQAMFIEEFE